MEKVILTEVQARAIEIFKNNTRDNLDNIAKRKVNDDPFQFEYEPFNDMTLEDISKSVYIGYEVEKPKFEVGDWAVRNTTREKNDKGWMEGYTFKIVSIEDGLRKENELVLDENGRKHLVTSLRHATKEEAFWAELLRQVNGIIEGDVVSTKFDFSYLVVGDLVNTTRKTCTVNDALGWILEGSVEGIYPAESFIRFPVGVEK